MEPLNKIPVVTLVTLLLIGINSTVMAQAIMPLTGTKGAATINEGIRLYNQGKWDASSSQFQNALKKNPRSAIAHYNNLPLALDRMGIREKASHHFKKASKLGRMNSFIRNSPILQQHLQTFKNKR